VLIFAGVVAGLYGLYRLLDRLGVIALVLDTEAFRAEVLGWGAFGPFAIIGLMAFAILFKPLPSAGVALASGAAFGHSWGTIYIIIGAELGALLAFAVTRLLGGDILCRLFGRRLTMEWEGSQKHMMGLLLVSRLIPVIPFDIVSYALGLTPLQTWRFILATLIGLIPSSFLLAHFGGEMVTTEFDVVLADMALAGVVVLLPVAAVIYLLKRRGHLDGMRKMVGVRHCRR